ncbi:MAG: SHOCT domain-containing protein [Lachnospiraceae bacterium]|nr:SHOCT domain-containing protein [Lachnospiraceae bacterium]
MALFAKESISGALGKAKELAGKATEAAKTGIDQTKTVVNEKREQSKQKKLPQEGGLIRYEVTYRGGHPDFQLGKKKSPYILLDIMPDRFSFLPDTQSEDWFTGFEIPYDRVVSLEIVERVISTAESILGSGNNNNDLRQKNVMEIKYLDEADNEFVVRNEMLTGFTVMGQARVCLEMLDLLRTNGIMKQFKGTESNRSNNASGGDDVLKQIEKLAALKESGIITEEEFNRKKAVLLEKL